LLLGLAVIPAGAADARTAIRVGIGDQQISMFDQPLFQRAKFERVRYFTSWSSAAASRARPSVRRTA
jgi:hypothetical protein